MRAFLTNSCLRPSCYKCSFKSIQRQADITLADFWGIQNVLPEMDDDKGTSLLLVHSNKGEQLIQAIKADIKYSAVSVDTVSKYNPAVCNSVSIGKYRQQYMQLFKDHSLDMLSAKFFKSSFKRVLIKALDKLGLLKILLKIKHRRGR